MLPTAKKEDAMRRSLLCLTLGAIFVLAGFTASWALDGSYTCVTNGDFLASPDSFNDFVASNPSATSHGSFSEKDVKTFHTDGTGDLKGWGNAVILPPFGSSLAPGALKYSRTADLSYTQPGEDGRFKLSIGRLTEKVTGGFQAGTTYTYNTLIEEDCKWLDVKAFACTGFLPAGLNVTASYSSPTSPTSTTYTEDRAGGYSSFCYSSFYFF
jgi:hypothetical protein